MKEAFLKNTIVPTTSQTTTATTTTTTGRRASDALPAIPSDEGVEQQRRASEDTITALKPGKIIHQDFNFW